MKKKILTALFIMALCIFTFGIVSASAATTINVSNVSDLQSAHNYSNNMDTTWIYTHPTAADSLEITFSTDTFTESGYDYIYILDKNGNQIGKYSGGSLAGKTITVSGNIVKIRLTSDGSVQKYGFKVTDIKESGPIRDFTGVKIDSTTMRFTFAAPEGATSVVLEYSTDGINYYPATKGLTETSTQATVTNLEICVKYWFRLNVIGGKCEGISKVFEYTLKEDFEFSNGVITGYVGSDSQIIIPEKINGITVTSIGDKAFENCSSLSSITIPNSVTSIGDDAFYNCESLTRVDITDIAAWCKIEFVDYHSNPLCYAKNLYLNGSLVTDLVIPDSVTSIGNWAFSICDSLSSINIPDSVTSIGYRAFEYCSSLSSIDIPDSVTSIGDDAFCYCSSLSSINIPDSVTSIGDDAFFCCSSLKSVSIGNGVTSIGDDAFYNCSSLSNIMVDKNNAYYASQDGVLFNKNMTELVCYPKGKTDSSYAIPDSVTSIVDDAFYNCDILSTISIPDSVTSIGNDAFCSCDSLRSINIPDSVTSIGDGAFEGCSSLSSISIPDSVTSIGNWAFSRCDSLSSISIGNGVTSIGNRAFYYCSSLRSIDIPDSVTSIGDYAFYDCSSLSSVSIGNGVTSIGDFAFEYCSSLTRVDITDIAAWCRIEFEDHYSNPLLCAENLYLNGSLVTDLVIPDSVTSIGNYAFRYCSSLRSIDIPDSVTSIGDDAFEYCSSLSSIDIPDSVTSIGDYAFYDCSSLTRVDITDIAAWCRIEFEDHYSNPLLCAENLYLNGSLVTDLVIPDSVTSIGDMAFYSCSSLNSVSIGNGVTSIGDFAFYYCKSLSSVSIGNNVTSIGDFSFYGCSSLKTVYYNGNQSEWNKISIGSYNDPLRNADRVYAKTYTFVTNCDMKLNDITGAYLNDAPELRNGQKAFAGWYDNAALSGTPITFPYYGEATTLYAAWKDRTGESFELAFWAKEGEKINKTVSGRGNIYFEFVPQATGEYKIYTTGGCDTYGRLYSKDLTSLAYSDDEADYNFYITHNLTAGETYYVLVGNYGAGEYSFVIETDKSGTKTEVSNDGKNFEISSNGIETGKTIVLALYNGDKCVEAQHAVYEGEKIFFNTDKEYTNAKVFVWNDLENITPAYAAEIVK